MAAYPEFTRRRLIQVSAAGLLGTVLSNTALTASASPAQLSPTDPVPNRGGTLRFGNIGDFQNLEPQSLPANGAADHLFSVWDTLVGADTDGTVQPVLAESWDILDNFQQFRFNLRRGVQFHTGRELTAADVLWSLRRIQDPKIGSVLTGRIEPVEDIQAVDKYTVVVTANRPWAEAFDVFQQANIIDPMTFETAGLSQPTGSGPFAFVEYAQGDHLRLRRNPNYWRSARPLLDEVLVTIHSDAQSAVAELEGGLLDVISAAMPISDVLRLSNDPNYQTLINDRTGACWIAFLNCTRAPTNDKRVRQAFNYALDRRRIADVIWRGKVQPLTLPWTPASPAFDAAKNTAYTYDLDRARALLAQAAVLPNMRLEIIYPTTAPEFGTIAQIYQSDLTKLGFEVQVHPLASAAFLAKRLNVDYDGVQLAFHQTGHLLPESNALGLSFGPVRNVAGFSDPAYNQLAAEVAVETDLTKQRALYDQLNDYYLDQSWAMPILPNPEHVTARSNVRGLRFMPSQGLAIDEVWLA